MNLERNFEMYRLKLGKLYGKLSFFPEGLSSMKFSSKKDKNGDLKKNILKLQEYMKNYNELKEKESKIEDKKNEESENLKKENSQLDSMNKNSKDIAEDTIKKQKKQVDKLKKQIESLEQQAKKLNDKAEEIKKKISDLLEKMSDYDDDGLKSMIEGIKNSIENKISSEEKRSEYLKMKQNFEDLKKRKKMITDVDKCMKRISNDLKELKRYRSWFFNKDNVAKTAYKFSFDLYRSIKKNLKQNDNLDDLFNVYDKLLMVSNYVRDAIKARIFEKKLHNNESDFTRNALKSLYDNFSNLCTIIFNERFSEIAYDFESLKVSKDETVEYYKKLIKSDLKKLYKKTSWRFKKDNAAKILYKYLSKVDVDKLCSSCESDIKNAIAEIKNEIELRRKEIIDRAKSKKKEVADNDFRNDETLIIMYHLLEDFGNLGKSLKIEIDIVTDMEDFDGGLEIDEQTAKNYQAGIDAKIAELSKPKEKIEDEIKKLKENTKDTIEKLKENLKNQISKFLNISYTSYMKTYSLDLSENPTVLSKCQEFTKSVEGLKFDDFLEDEKAHEKFKSWGENFSKVLDGFIPDLKAIAKKEFESKNEGYNYGDYNINQSILGIQSDIKKIVSETYGHLENNSKDIFSKIDECKEYSEKINNYKKDSEKIFKKDSKSNLRLRAIKGAKILGDVVTSFFIPGANVGRVVVTLEGVKLVKKIAGTSGVDKSSIVILVSETDIDCKLFKVASSSPAKLRVYLTLSAPLLLNMLSKVPDGTRIVDCIGNLDIQNNFRSGKIYFHPYGGHTEKYEVEKEDPNIRYDKKKMALKAQKDYGKSKQIMKEIKAKIAELKPSILGKVFKFDITKSVYEPINHIYKNFRKSLKSASADDVESKEFLRAAKSLVSNKLSDFQPKNEQDQEKYSKMNQYLAELFVKLVDLEKYMFGYESELKSEKEMKQFMDSQDRAKIFGEILAAADLDIGALIFTIENATLKGLMSAGNEYFMPGRNSYVACVADLNIKMTLDSYLEKKEDEGYAKSITKNILAFVGTSGVTANIISGGAKMLGFGEGAEMVNTFASFLNILSKGIRIRTYVSVDNLTFATKMINITTKLQKGKTQLIK